MNLSPCIIKRLHGVRGWRLLASLAADMAENGWEGRPLLVIQRKSGWLAWTGSHRIAAVKSLLTT